MDANFQGWTRQSLDESFGGGRLETWDNGGTAVALAPADLAPTRRTRKLLEHIFISGNFGRFDANGRDHSEVPYLVRKWRSFTFQSKRLAKLFRLFPGYSSAYMWHWFTGAVVRFVTGTDR